MTVEEYIANPESWEPTFICDSNATLSQWLSNTSGYDYERVKIIGTLTAAGNNINLTTRGTKQIVFDDGAAITVSGAADGFSYDTLPDDDEYWMFSPTMNIYAVTGYGIKNCKNIINITGVLSYAFASNAVATDSFFNNCENVVVSSITATRSVSTAAASVHNFAVFRNCRNISGKDSASAVTVTGQNGTAANYEICAFSDSQLIDISQVTISVLGTGAHTVCGFARCNEITADSITLQNYGVAVANTLIALLNCGTVQVNTTVIQITATTSLANNAFYGAKGCANLVVNSLSLGSTGTASPAYVFGIYECENVEFTTITAVARFQFAGLTLSNYVSGDAITGSFVELNPCKGIDQCKWVNLTSLRLTIGAWAVPAQFYGIEASENVTIETIIMSVGGSSRGANNNGKMFGATVSKNISITNLTLSNANQMISRVSGAFNVQGIRFPGTVFASAYGGTVIGVEKCSRVTDTSALRMTVQTTGAGGTTAQDKFNPLYWLSELKCFPVIPVANRPLRVAWEFLSTTNEHPVKAATLAVSYNNGTSWTNLYTGNNKTYTFTPSSTESLVLRITDTTSWKIEGTAGELLDSYPPLISGTDGDIGSFSEAFTPFAYTVTKYAEDTEAWTSALVTESVDGRQLRSFTAEAGTEYFFEIAGMNWTKTLNGAHELIITALKPQGGFAERVVTFEKNENTIRFSCQTPQISDEMPVVIRPRSMTGSLPEEAEITIEACNNGLDELPVWEDVTASYLTDTDYTFTNTSKTAPLWGVNIRVTIERGVTPPATPINIVEMSASWDW